jgi:hypothetical protein
MIRTAETVAKDHVGTQIKDQAWIAKPEIASIAASTDGRQDCDVRHT